MSNPLQSLFFISATLPQANVSFVIFAGWAAVTLTISSIWQSILHPDCVFYDRMTVHRNRFLVNKTNRCAEFQFYWYYDCTCFGQLFCPSSGVLSRYIGFGTFYAVVMTVSYQKQDGTAEQFHPAPGS